MSQATAALPSVVTDAPFHPSLAVADLAKARSWYAEKLGWEPVLEPPGVHIYKVGESFFTLFETEFAGTAKNTVMNWSVDDVRAEVSRLRERGVAFEEYDFGEAQTVDGIMTDPSGGMNAWFKDLDGNIVGVISAGEGGPRLEPGSEITAMIAASDLDRAQRWYSEKLGFEPDFTFPDVLATYKSGASMFTVYKTEFAGTAKNTVGLWRLKGIRDEVARLRGNGVVFEDYDFGDGDKTVGGILSDAEGDQNAWFKDSEGNILAIAEDRGGVM
jgi:catechol 2,3-dioxygenase-like lactoylglutathione lyase family enzyme